MPQCRHWLRAMGYAIGCPWSYLSKW